MASQPLAFGLLLGGGILLTAGLSGRAIAEVVQGKVQHLPSGPSSLGIHSGDVQQTVAANPNAGYVNPLAQANVRGERIDMGVDYAGTGTIAAIGSGVVTHVDPKGWGKYGGFIQYKLTDGPLAGHYVYYAEGVDSLVKVGDRLRAGQAVARIIPGWHSGIEIGWGSGKPNQTYAQVHGGYVEGQLTAAGKAFSDLIAALGAPAGTTGGRQVSGGAFA